MKGVGIMELYPKGYNKNESGEEIGTALLHLIEKSLDIKRWKFRLTFTKFIKTSHIKVIYDSEWCRVKFIFSRMRYPDSDELTIDYARLHAPNEEPFMVWNGEECRCWHNIWQPLYFLDGLSPSEAVHKADIQNQLPLVAENFWHSKRGKDLREEYIPKYGIVLQSVLWEHYEQRLFELFDLRQSKLWNQYKHFLEEYYKLLDRKAIYGPPYENVC
jgi:hypothetical protein